MLYHPEALRVVLRSPCCPLRLRIDLPEEEHEWNTARELLSGLHWRYGALRGSTGQCLPKVSLGRKGERRESTILRYLWGVLQAWGLLEERGAAFTGSFAKLVDICVGVKGEWLPAPRVATTRKVSARKARLSWLEAPQHLQGPTGSSPKTFVEEEKEQSGDMPFLDYPDAPRLCCPSALGRECSHEDCDLDCCRSLRVSVTGHRMRNGVSVGCLIEVHHPPGSSGERLVVGHRWAAAFCCWHHHFDRELYLGRRTPPTISPMVPKIGSSAASALPAELPRPEVAAGALAAEAASPAVPDEGEDDEEEEEDAEEEGEDAEEEEEDAEEEGEEDDDGGHASKRRKIRELIMGVNYDTVALARDLLLSDCDELPTDNTSEAHLLAHKLAAIE